MALDEHNPDSNCVMCCTTMERLNSLLDTAEALMVKVSDPNAMDALPPMLKVALKMLGK